MLSLKLGLSLNSTKRLGGGGAAFPNLYSLDFDGVDDYVTFGDNVKFSIPGSGSGFSVSAWVKTTGADDCILSKFDSATTAEYKLEIGRDNKITFFVFSSGSSSINQFLRVDSPVVGDGNWHHVAATFDLTNSSTSIVIFIDGVLYNVASGGTTYSSTGTWVGATNTTAPLEVGRLGTGANYFGGNIDEVAIFTKKLIQSDITDIYNSGTPTDLSGLSNLNGYWRNGDTAGTSVFPTIEDYSSNSNDGTMTNMVSGDIVTVVP